MGIFTRPVRVAGATNIFARAAKDGRQFLAYNFRYEADDDFALILPLPTPPETLPTDVRFIDLSGYDAFFRDLRRGFPTPPGETEKMSLTDRIIEKVRDWLDIDTTQAAITFAPNHAALSHIQDQFQLTADVLRLLERFDKAGFVCLKLAAGTNRVPPMAFEFPRRRSTELFFPTALAIGADLDATAAFNYQLFCQAGRLPPEWRSVQPAPNVMKADKTRGLIDPDQPIGWRALVGPQANLDTFIPSA
jgi:hypothetical protein